MFQRGSPSSSKPPKVCYFCSASAYVGNGADQILGLDTRSGHRVWTAKVAGVVTSAYRTRGGVSGINIGDGVLTVVDDADVVVFGD